MRCNRPFHLSFPKIHILVIQRDLSSPVVAQTRFVVLDLIDKNKHSRIADLQGRNDSKRGRCGPKDSLRIRLADQEQSNSSSRHRRKSSKVESCAFWGCQSPAPHPPGSVVPSTLPRGRAPSWRVALDAVVALGGVATRVGRLTHQPARASVFASRPIPLGTPSLHRAVPPGLGCRGSRRGQPRAGVPLPISVLSGGGVG